MNIDELQTLAALDLTEDERPSMVADLNRLQDSIDRLLSVDTSQIPPTYRPLDSPARSRPDRSESPMDCEAILANAPQRDGNYVAVPSTLPTDRDDC